MNKWGAIKICILLDILICLSINSKVSLMKLKHLHISRPYPKRAFKKERKHLNEWFLTLVAHWHQLESFENTYACEPLPEIWCNGSRVHPRHWNFKKLPRQSERDAGGVTVRQCDKKPRDREKKKWTCYVTWRLWEWRKVSEAKECMWPLKAGKVKGILFLEPPKGKQFHGLTFDIWLSYLLRHQFPSRSTILPGSIC